MTVLNALRISASILAIVFTAVMVIHCFYDDRIQLSLKKAGLIMGLVFAANIVNRLAGDTLDEFALLPLMTLIIPVAVVLWGIKDRFISYLRLCLMLILTAIVTVFYSMQPVMLCCFILGMRGLYDNMYIMAASLAVDLIAGAALYFGMARKGRTMLFRRRDNLLVIILCMAVLLSAGLIGQLDEKETVTKNDKLMALLLLALLIMTPIMIFKNRQSSYYSELSSKNEAYLEAELAASRQYRESQEETRAFRHDMKNQLYLLREMIHKKDYSRAEEYVSDLCGELAELSPRVVTGDDMLDSLVSIKLDKLEKAGIKFTIDGVIDGGLDWKPQDICAVFANALDNAAEACKKLEEDKQKYIRLSFRKTKMQRIIKISNSAAAKADCEKLMSDTAHYTSKEDKTLHGFGMRNIRRTVEKYGGIMELSSTDSEFTMTIVLTK